MWLVLILFTFFNIVLTLTRANPEPLHTIVNKRIHNHKAEQRRLTSNSAASSGRLNVFTIPMGGKGWGYGNSPKLVAKNSKLWIENNSITFKVEELAVADMTVALPGFDKRSQTRTTKGKTIFMLLTQSDTIWTKIARYRPFSGKKKRHLLVSAIPRERFDFDVLKKRFDLLKDFVRDNLGSSIEFKPKEPGVAWKDVDQWKLSESKDGRFVVSEIGAVDLGAEDVKSMVSESLTILPEKADKTKLGKYALIGVSILNLQQHIGGIASQMISEGVGAIIRDFSPTDLDFLK